MFTVLPLPASAAMVYVVLVSTIVVVPADLSFESFKSTLYVVVLPSFVFVPERVYVVSFAVMTAPLSPSVIITLSPATRVPAPTAAPPSLSSLTVNVVVPLP